MMTFNFGLLTATVMAVIPSGSWPAHIDSHGFKAHIVYVAFVLYQGCQVYYCLCGETDEIFDFVTGSNQSPYFRKPLSVYGHLAISRDVHINTDTRQAPRDVASQCSTHCSAIYM